MNIQISHNLFGASPDRAWRWVFLTGLVPAAVAVVVRSFVEEPERWTEQAARTSPPALSPSSSPGTCAG